MRHNMHMNTGGGAAGYQNRYTYNSVNTAKT